MNVLQYSISEILRLHLESAGAFRSEKLIMWLYQQRGGFRLADDPGVAFRMEEPQGGNSQEKKFLENCLEIPF